MCARTERQRTALDLALRHGHAARTLTLTPRTLTLTLTLTHRGHCGRIAGIAGYKLRPPYLEDLSPQPE
eukprot:scaffold22051_cov51-Phaeocystis_antarctica.AAC.2